MMVFDVMTIELFVLFLLFFGGASVGSFANVVAMRYGTKESFAKGRSRCDSCNKTIPFYYNIPLVSYVFLLGKCFSCKSPIPFRHFCYEVIFGVLALAVYLVHGGSYFGLELLLFTCFVGIASAVDLDHFILPNVITYPGIILSLVFSFVSENRNFEEALFGVVFFGMFFWLTAYLFFVIKKKEGLGGGDVKLFAWVGGFLGLQNTLFVVMLSSLLGVFYAVSILTWAKLSKKQEDTNPYIPFGPFIFVATILVSLLIV